MGTDKGCIMSYIWHEPDTEHYWIGRQTGSETVIVDVAGVCRLLTAWQDPRETVYYLQQLLLDWVMLVTKPDETTHDVQKNDIYRDMVEPSEFTRQLHECICSDPFTVSLYNEFVKQMKDKEQ